MWLDDIEIQEIRDMLSSFAEDFHIDGVILSLREMTKEQLEEYSV